MDEEIWKDVCGYEGLYQVSNWGKVKSLNYRGTGKEKILRPQKNGWGYFYVFLCKNGKRKKYFVHRLVLMTFNPCENSHELQVNHINECKIDNRLENLEWCTALYNLTYNDRHKKIGEKLRGRTLSDETRKKMSENHADFKGENNPMYGKHLSEEHKLKIIKSNKGRTLSEESRRKISESLKGKYCGKNNPNYGKHHSAEARRKNSEAHSIPIVQIDESTNKVVNVWGSGTAAAREGGFHQGAINDCCKGKRKTHKGYRWCYLKDWLKEHNKGIPKKLYFIN